jgi:hypothetical protein
MSDLGPELDRPSSPLELRHASTEHPLVVVVPARRFLVIDGAGYPGAADFRFATSVLRTVDELLRARLRRDRFADSPRAVIEIVWKIEPSWSIDEIVAAFTERVPRPWRQMLELPRASTEAVVTEAIDEARRQGGRDVPLVRLVEFAEGRVAQILYHGPAADEAGSIEKLYRHVVESGLRPRGDLHQLVLADPDRVPAERARSIFRLPIEADQPL